MRSDWVKRFRAWCARPYIESVVQQCAALSVDAQNNARVAGYRAGYLEGWNTLAQAIAQSDEESIADFRSTTLRELNARKMAH